MAFRKLFFKRVQGIRDNYLLQEGDIALDEDDFQLYRGDGSTVGGIAITSTGGTSADTVTVGNGTDVTVTGGESTASGSTGGNTIITGGTGVSTGGDNNVIGGTGGTTGGGTNVTGGTGGTNGGATSITGGTGTSGTGGNTNITGGAGGTTGGNVNINGGNGSTDGNINIGTENTTLITIGTSGNNIDFPATTTIDFTGATVTGLGVSGIANDIKNDTTPQLGGNLDLNNFDITGTGDINITGTVTASGGVTFSGTTDFDTITTDGLSISDNSISATRSNDDLTLSASGTGLVVVRSNMRFNDNDKLLLGDSNDLEVFHNGSHSFIKDSGTGSLKLLSNNFNVRNVADTEHGITYTSGGAVELYHNGVKKFDTGSHGVDIVDEAHIEGATPHLTLKRTDNANVPTVRFKGSGGTVGATIEFDGTSGTSNELIFKTFPGLTLTERFRVTYTGASVIGNLQMGESNTDATITTNGTGDLILNTNGGTNAGTITMRDGANGDIILETDGTGDVLLKGDKVGVGTVNQPDTLLHLKDTNSVITLQRTNDANTPGLSFQNSGGNVRATIKMDGTSGTSKELVFQTDDGSLAERFRVTLSGAKVTGNLQLGSTTAVSGVLDEDNLASDSATALATQQSIKAYVDGRFTQTTTTVNTLATDGLTITDNNVSANRTNDDLILSASGTGNVNINSNAKFNDNVKLLFGDSDDLQIWHNATNSIIQNSTGQLQLRGNTIRLLNAATDEDFAFFNDDGSVDLYHNNTKRFETTSDGISVTDHIALADNGELRLGTDNDMQISHSGVSGLVKSTTGTLVLQGSTVRIQDAGSSQTAISAADGVATLYHTNTAVLNTTAGGIQIEKGVQEKFHTVTGASGVTALDCSNGHIFYKTGCTGDITANFTNLTLTAEYAVNLMVIINQGGTPYEVTAVQIGGSAQTLNWQGGSAPTGNANGIDAFSFTILNDGGSYVVLGQMVDFT